MNTAKMNTMLLIGKKFKDYGVTKYQVDSVKGIIKEQQWGVKLLGRGYTTPGAPGSGAGKGGGGGGSVRESGGGLGRYAAAHEEEYFFNKKREQLEKIKKKMSKEEAKPPSPSQKP